MIGINISGAEFGGGIGGNNDSQYHWPTLSELQYYQARGVDLVRIPFSWERMQPNAWGALSATELGLLKTLLSNAATLGMDVIIDLHNYGRYFNNAIGASNGPSAAQFADFWAKLASEVKGFTSLVGYDLMNEPHDMPTATAWKDAAQAAVNAIRTVDATHNIYVEGDAWSGAHSWQQYNADFIINDPAGRLIYQAHQYFDRDSSGTYSGTYDQEGAYATVGVDRLKPFVDWLNQHGFKGMIGEFGAPSNDPRWLEVTKNAVAYMNANGLVGTAWGGGTWWPSSYSMFMGAPGQTDSAYLSTLKDYFTPYSWTWLSTTTPTPEKVYHNQVIGSGVVETVRTVASVTAGETGGTDTAAHALIGNFDHDGPSFGGNLGFKLALLRGDWFAAGQTFGPVVRQTSAPAVAAESVAAPAAAVEHHVAGQPVVETPVVAAPVPAAPVHWFGGALPESFSFAPAEQAVVMHDDRTAAATPAIDTHLEGGSLGWASNKWFGMGAMAMAHHGGVDADDSFGHGGVHGGFDGLFLL